jgi:hypothetical protein
LKSVLSLYQQFVSPTITKADLIHNGKYVPKDKYNNSTTNGAMYLVQGANTLGAEIDISVRSTIIRKINGTVLTGERELIDCGQYGDPDRNSDPHIAAQVNALARKDAFIPIANPVALYIAGFAPVGWQTPCGSDPRDFWKIVRGDQAHALRAVYEVAHGEGFHRRRHHHQRLADRLRRADRRFHHHQSGRPGGRHLAGSCSNQ